MENQVAVKRKPMVIVAVVIASIITICLLTMTILMIVDSANGRIIPIGTTSARITTTMGSYSFNKDDDGVRVWETSEYVYIRTVTYEELSNSRIKKTRLQKISKAEITAITIETEEIK